MKLPKIDLEEMKRFKEENFRERLKFMDLYAEWVLKNSNKSWSSQSNKIQNSSKK